MGICPNAYYNYKKHRKDKYREFKAGVKQQIEEIYHGHGGVDGYRTMRIYLGREGISLSLVTVHKYMNTELGLKSIARPKRPDYRKGESPQGL